MIRNPVLIDHSLRLFELRRRELERDAAATRLRHDRRRHRRQR